MEIRLAKPASRAGAGAWLGLAWQFSDSMFSFESDKMTPLWQNDSLTFTFYATFSNSIADWTNFVKFVSDLMLNSASDKILCDYIAAKLSLLMPHSHFSYSIPNWETFVKDF